MAFVLASLERKHYTHTQLELKLRSLEDAQESCQAEILDARECQEYETHGKPMQFVITSRAELTPWSEDVKYVCRQAEEDVAAADGEMHPGEGGQMCWDCEKVPTTDGCKESYSVDLCCI